MKLYSMMLLSCLFLSSAHLFSMVLEKEDGLSLDDRILRDRPVIAKEKQGRSTPDPATRKDGSSDIHIPGETFGLAGIIASGVAAVTVAVIWTKYVVRSWRADKEASYRSFNEE